MEIDEVYQKVVGALKKRWNTTQNSSFCVDGLSSPMLSFTPAFAKWQGQQLTSSKWLLISRSQPFLSSTQSLNKERSILPKKTEALNEGGSTGNRMVCFLWAKFHMTALSTSISFPVTHPTLESHFLPLFSTVLKIEVFLKTGETDSGMRLAAKKGQSICSRGPLIRLSGGS